MGHTWGGQPQDDNKVNCRLGNVRCAPFVMYMSDNVSIVLRNKHIMKYPTIWEYIGPLIFSTQLDILSKMSQIVVLITCYPFILCCLNYILSYHPISFHSSEPSVFCGGDLAGTAEVLTIKRSPLLPKKINFSLPPLIFSFFLKLEVRI